MVYEGKADIASIMGTHEEGLEFKRILFKNEKVKSVLKVLLPIFDSKGLFDQP